MEQKTLSAEPRRSFSNEFKLQIVKLALEPGTSVTRITREHDINNNLQFKWLRFWQISSDNNSSDVNVELLSGVFTVREHQWQCHDCEK